MLKIATKTKLSPEDAIKKAVEFFGPNGYRLEVKVQLPDYASLEGGGGGIQVVARVVEKETSVDIESREWDYQVKEFIGKIR